MSVQLMLGDCLELLPLLTGVNAVITDPPYGIGYSPSQNSSKAFCKKTFVGDVVVHGDDIAFDPKPLLRFPIVVLFGANNYADKLPSSTEWIIWDKRQDFPSNDFADCEMIWTNGKGTARIFRHLWSGAIRASERGEPRLHPTQKPLVLMKWLIERYTKPGDTVLDPYAGSGTTAIACIQTGRNFIGYEISAHYHALAINRIADAQMQLSLPLLETA